MGAYSRAYRVNLDEAMPEPGPYASFDAFFTRPLKDGRTLDQLRRRGLSADGKLSSCGRVDSGSRIFVKGQHYDVGELIGDARDAARYSGGEFAVVYLAPGDYHRVHSPVDGEISLVRGIAGDLYPVNSIGRSTSRSSSCAIIAPRSWIDTRGLGRVTVVMVGAVIVGRITITALPGRPAAEPGLHPVTPPKRVARGDEIGMFHLGSTAVVLLEPGLSVGRPLGKVRFR